MSRSPHPHHRTVPRPPLTVETPPPEQPAYMPPVVDTPSPDATAVVAAMAQQTLAEMNNRTLFPTSVDSPRPASAITGADEAPLPASVGMSEAAALNTPTDTSSPKPAVDPAQVGVTATTSQSYWHEISPPEVPSSSVLVPVANAPGEPVPVTPVSAVPQMTGLTPDMVRPVIPIAAKVAVGANGLTETPRKAPSEPVDPDANPTAVGDAEDEEAAEGLAG